MILFNPTKTLKMRIATADSMREAIMLHFEKAGHRFQLYGRATTTVTSTGHEIGMWRSGEIIRALDSNAIDVALIGTDIIEERNIRYKFLRRKPPELHDLQRFPDYGRQFITPKLDIVIHKDLLDAGITGVQPAMIFATEHPFTIRALLEERGFKPVFVGRGNSPPENDRFRRWACKKNEETIRRIERGEETKDGGMIVGIDEVDGKITTALTHGLADIGTIVTESGTTNIDNRLVELETISEIRMVLIARQAYINENPNHHTEVHKFGGDLINAYAISRREFMSRKQKEMESHVGGSPER